jgi:hypothetical protein
MLLIAANIATQGQPHKSSILNGFIVLNIKLGSDVWWLHISLMFRAPVRPTLLRMVQAPVSNGERIELHVCHALDKHKHHKAQWLTLWQVVDMLTLCRDSIRPPVDGRRCTLSLWRLDEMGWTDFPPCRAVVVPVVDTIRQVSLTTARRPRQQAEANTQGGVREGSDNEFEGDEDGNEDVGFDDSRGEDHVDGFGPDNQCQHSDLEDVAAAWADAPIHTQPPSPRAPVSPVTSSSSSSSSSNVAHSSVAPGGNSSSSSSSSSSSTGSTSSQSEAGEDDEEPIEPGLPGIHSAAEEVPEILAVPHMAPVARGREPRNSLTAEGVTIHHVPGSNSAYAQCTRCRHRVTRTFTTGHRRGKGRPLGLLAAWATAPCDGRAIHSVTLPESGPQHVFFYLPGPLHIARNIGFTQTNQLMTTLARTQAGGQNQWEVAIEVSPELFHLCRTRRRSR